MPCSPAITRPVLADSIGQPPGGVHELGEPAVTELLLDWLDPFMMVEEQDRLLGWHLGEALVHCPSSTSTLMAVAQGLLPQ